MLNSSLAVKIYSIASEEIQIVFFVREKEKVTCKNNDINRIDVWDNLKNRHL